MFFWNSLTFSMIQWMLAIWLHGRSCLISWRLQEEKSLTFPTNEGILPADCLWTWLQHRLFPGSPACQLLVPCPWSTLTTTVLFHKMVKKKKILKRLFYLATRRRGAISVSTEGWSSILRRRSGSKILMLIGAWVGEEGVKGISGELSFRRKNFFGLFDFVLFWFFLKQKIERKVFGELPGRLYSKQITTLLKNWGETTQVPINRRLT